MKQPFYEDYQNPKRDPLTPTCTEFDMRSVEEALGELPSEDWRTEEERKAAIIVRSIFEFTTRGIDLRRHDVEKFIGRRLVGLAWVLDPSLIDGSPSAASLAKALGVNPKTFARITGEVSKRFGITNRAQDHAWNRSSPCPPAASPLHQKTSNPITTSAKTKRPISQIRAIDKTVHKQDKKKGKESFKSLNYKQVQKNT